MRSFVAIVLAVMPTAAQAERWIKISTGEEAVISVDIESIKVLSPTMRQAWFENAIRPEIKDIEYKRVLTLSKADCSNDAIAPVSFVGYRRDGKVDTSGPVADHDLEWRPAAPGTGYGSMIKALCSKP